MRFTAKRREHAGSMDKDCLSNLGLIRVGRELRLRFTFSSQKLGNTNKTSRNKHGESIVAREWISPVPACSNEGALPLVQFELDSRKCEMSDVDRFR